MFRIVLPGAAAGLLLLAACTPAALSPTQAPSSEPTAPPTAASATPLAPTTPPATPTPAVTAAPSAPASAPATAPATTFPEGAVIVTFAVEAEQFRVLLTDPADIDIAQALLDGEEAPSIPNGLIVYGEPGVNAPWTWHIDPDSVEFADMTIEVCDGLPSHVEDRVLTSDRYCPWGAQVISVEPAGQ